MIRAVICDFGGVLTSPLIESFRAYEETSGVKFEELGKAMARATERRGGEHPLFDLERGRITEAEFLSLLEAELGEGVHLGSLRETYFAHLHPNAPMIDYMRELRGRGLRMALLTNSVRSQSGTSAWDHLLPNNLFEVVINSFEVGLRKPEPEIYTLALDRLGGDLAADECLFVDDTAINCEAAQRLGMPTIQFTETEPAIAAIERVLAS